MKNKVLYVNEAEYHQIFINNICDFPVEMKNQVDNKVLVWAHELRLYDAGSAGGDGFADILTVDEDGFVWIIEAKMYNSNELNSAIWDYQLSRYRNALMKNSWNDIHRYIKSFIRGKESTKPQTDIFKDTNDLKEAIEIWQKNIGRSKHAPTEIVNRIATHLKNGTFGIAVLAEIEEKSVAVGAEKFEHSGPLAYIRAVEIEGEFVSQCIWIDKRNSESKIMDCLEKPNYCCFDEYDKKKKKIKGSLDTFVNGLSNTAAVLFKNEILPTLLRFGWDGKDVKKNQKSITCSLPVAGKKLQLIQFGWSDTDAKAVDRENKNIGTAAFKFDFKLWMCKNELFSTKENIEKWCSMFYKIGWRGKGKGINAGIKPLTEKDFEKWRRTMVYYPQDGTKDFIGRSDDAEALHKFFDVLKNVIDKMEKYYDV